MTGSETIGAQPLDKVEVFGNDSIVHSFTTNLQKNINKSRRDGEYNNKNTIQQQRIS